MQDEQWKPCPGYEGIYEVSSTGKVRRVCTTRGSGAGYVLKGLIDGHGYRTYTLRKNGVFRSEKAHRLVCEAFVPWRTEERRFVNHKNGNKQDNRAANLEWVTHRENIRHAYDCGLVAMENRKGAKHPKARAVCRVAKDGSCVVFETIKEACAATPGARRDRVWMALTGRLQSHAGFVWRNP